MNHFQLGLKRKIRCPPPHPLLFLTLSDTSPIQSYMKVSVKSDLRSFILLVDNFIYFWGSCDGAQNWTQYFGYILAGIYLVKVGNRSMEWNMFKVNNKDTRTTPMPTYFTPCSSVFIANFEHVIAGWDWDKVWNEVSNLNVSDLRNSWKHLSVQSQLPKHKKRCHWRRSSVFIANCRHSGHLFYVFHC